MEDGKRFPGYLFTDRKFIEEGFVILSFENVLAEVGISTGTFKRGPIYTITLGKGFKIYELDGRPAGYLPKTLLKNIDGERLEYLWYTPFIIIDDKGNHHAVRTFKGFTDEYIEVWAPIKEGQKVKLSFLIPEEILKDTEKTARRLKATIKTADLCLNFSCTARQYTLEDKAEEELIIYGSVVNAPLFGFFTHGEITLNPNSNKKKLEIHNQTSVGVALKEI
ncbi:FIST C-terminal domain-containing protein [Desulfurobacterium thermolithotrophum]|uniref:FIST C-terminal domain-containing protein n=1 Tax=Desulfurobacterium thermolithotrophum TaxID=64160 RepID=UPI0003077C2B|nr:FIST C-terminal domain-containing protein [Desulfurobacterium thermolithotrophum]